MKPAVLDASALAAICFGEPEGPSIADRLAGAELYSIALLDFELANVAWKKLRRAAADRQLVTRAFELRARLRIITRPVVVAEVIDMALAAGLTAYDANYLWLARHLDAELITLDKRLDRVARAMP